MTTKHIVADDVLGMVSRSMHELQQKIMDGSADVDRVLALLHQATTTAPAPHQEDPNRDRAYVLESRWAYDSSHSEFVTLTFESYELNPPTLDDILSPEVEHDKKQALLKALQRIFETQIPTHGARKMVRLYRVVHQNMMGCLPKRGASGMVTREVVDLNLVLKPICDFDDTGNPVRCIIHKDTQWT